MQRLQITVRGRVQGVAFRWHARARARELGLVGTVRNRADGSVRMVAEGPRPALEALAAWALRGPDRARVEARELLWGEPTGAFAEFEITG
ncbi:MAG: acylphosphatase [Candidatus Krumholzibacteriia bacterium]